MSSSLLAREARALVARLRTFTPVRYAAACVPVGDGPAAPGTRGDVVHHLAQSLADRCADLEGLPRRVLPRLPSDLALADQLAVTADDLLRAQPPEAVAAACTAHLLLHRSDLLGDAVPAGLAAELGVGEVTAAGRSACATACEERGGGPLDR